MSYKSKHSGAQVDEAVSKVLNGEVGGGADWNAQEGEAGYIENKPFWDKIDQKFDKSVLEDQEHYTYTIDCNPNDSQTFIMKWDEVDRENHYTKVGGRYIEYNLFEYRRQGNYPTLISQISETAQFDISVTISYNTETEKLEVTFDGSEIWYEIERVSYRLLETDVLYDSRHIGSINALYLRDVIKTVPQHLSDVDKNQALANLGIDPVVWKYMCNPFMVWDAQPIPDELHSIIYSENDNKLNPIVKNVLIIEYYSIASVSDYELSVTTADKNQVKYIYDPLNKTFNM